MGGALALIALAALQATSDLPARGTLAGFRALETASTIVYAARPEPAHVLRATYAFPSRSRWAIVAVDGATTVRTLTYVRGATAASVPPGRGESRALEGAEAHAARAQSQLRLALFLWPQSHAWTGAGDERRCEFERGEYFRARLAESTAGTPVEIAWCSSDGREIDSFRAITWRTESARAWPATFELWHDGARVWSERVDSIDTKLRVVESFFVPPDRREVARADPNGAVGLAPRAMDVPGAWTSRTALAEGATLEAALEAEARRRTTAGGELEALLESTRTLEIDERGRPIAIVLRARGTQSPGEGFVFVPEAPAWTARIVNAAGPLEATLARLESALPTDARLRSRWLRLVGSANSAGVLVVTFDAAD